MWTFLGFGTESEIGILAWLVQMCSKQIESAIRVKIFQQTVNQVQYNRLEEIGNILDSL